MKKSFVRAGITVACAAVLLAGNLAYAQTTVGWGGALLTEITDSLSSGVSAIASSFGFTSANQVSETSGSYVYNSNHEGMNAEYANAQGDTLTINYCENGAYVATAQTVCSSAPNSCGMVGTGYMTTVSSAEQQVASSQTACSAVTPSDSLCPARSRTTHPSGSMCPNGAPPAGASGQCTCAQGNLNACQARGGICPDGTAAAGGNSAACTCAQGNISACTNGAPNSGTGSGPNGCITENGQCVSSCDVGYTQQGKQCVFSGCPTGYSQQGTQCIFSGCPNGYTQQGTQCVFSGCSAGYICQNGNQYSVNADCVVSSSPTQTCTYGCSSDACNAPPSPEITTWDATPTLLKAGETVSIQWQSQDVASCSVTGTNGDSWSGLSGTETSQPILGQTIYTINCDGYPGATPASASESATINVVPGFNEQ